MIRRSFILFTSLYLFFIQDIMATHVAGGEITYTCLGNNEYEVTLTFYRDCAQGTAPFPASPTIRIYNSNGAQLQTLSLSGTGVTTIQPTPPGPCTQTLSNVCLEAQEFTGIVVLPPIPGGYKLGYEICCRNHSITNGPPSRAAYTTSIPDISLAQCNSNPVFNEWPPVYICQGFDLEFDHSATDADNDSLVYRICEPLERVEPDVPYAFTAPYTWQDPINGGLSIDPQTGLLTGNPPGLGQFVVGVCVDEYRNGQLISTVSRDFQFNVVHCENVTNASALSALTDCTTSEVSFFNNSSGDIVSYLWDFGDGNTSTLENPVHNYADTGSYQVTLITYSANSLCNDTSTNIVATVEPCKPCGMEITTSTNPADCQPGGCVRVTCVVPCADCPTSVQIQCGGISSTTGGCGGTTNIGGGNSPCTSNCGGCVVNCGGINLHDIPSVNCTYTPTVDCIGGVSSTADGTIRTIVYSDYINAVLGDATVNITGGTPPYSIQWVTTPTQTGPTATDLSVGCYTVIVTDANGCVAVDLACVSGNSDIVPNLSKSDVTACGLNNGTATVNPTGGSGNYTYEWLPGGQTSQTVNGLAPGSYTVIIDDGSNCPYVENFIIEDVVNIDINLNITDILCPGDSTGAVQTVVSGGSPPYTYTWNTSPSQNTANVSGLTAGFYTVTVTDSDGCIGVQSLTINETPAFNITPNGSTLNCNGDNNGLATVSVTGGTAPYSFSWNTSPQQFTQTATGLGAGNYDVVISDANNCEITQSVTVNQPNIIDIDLVDISTGGCSGNFIGEAEVFSTGGTLPHSYSWCNGQTSNIATNIPPGSWCTLTLTDANGCIRVDSILLEDFGVMNPVVSSTDMCAGANDATATVNPNGGQGPFTFLWSGGQTTQTIAGLSAGTYSVTITDANGCIEVDSVNVQDSPPLNLNVLTDPGSCNSGDGTVEVLVSGGTSPYTFTWPTGDTTQIVNNLEDSTYLIWVWDANNCFDTISATIISDPCGPTVTVEATPDTICLGECTALSASAIEGDPPYDFIWNNNVPNGPGPHTVCPVITTTYQVIAIDSLNNQDTTQVTVHVNELPNIITNIDTTICFGSPINLFAEGGNLYEWNNGLYSGPGPHLVIPDSSISYNVIVTDSNACVDTASFLVELSPLPLAETNSDTIICRGETVDLSATGGIFYNWNNNLPSTAGPHTVAPDSSTTYTVEVTNVDGCVDTANVTIIVNQIPDLTITGDTAICENQSVVLIASGGVSYVWDNNLPAGPGPHTVSPLNTTTFIVEVTDNNGCIESAQVEVEVNSLPVATISADTIICAGDSVELFADGGISYNWDNGLPSIPGPHFVTPIALTTYTVEVTDLNGCSDTVETTIDVNPLPMVNTGSDAEICIGDSAVLFASGGNTYSWSNNLFSGPGPHNVSPGSTTNYIVEVTDSNLCVNSDSILVIVNDLPNITVIPDTSICIGSSIDISADGGQIYLWNNNVPSGPGPHTISPDSTLIYTVVVTDNNGCIDSASTNIAVNALPDVIISDDIDICQGESATISASGGVNYDWNPNLPSTGGPHEVSPLVNTLYTVIVTDNNNCQSSASVSVNVNSLPQLDLGNDTVVCEGDIVLLDVQAQNHTYEWQDGSTDSEFLVLISGLYSVTVTNSSGCIASDSIDIQVLSPPQLEISGNNTLCPGESAVLTASGGLSYEWNTGALSESIEVTPLNTINEYYVSSSIGSCFDTATFIIEVVDPIPANAGTDAEIYENESVVLGGIESGSFIWEPDYNLDCVNCPFPNASPDESVLYTVFYTDEFGCESKDSVFVRVKTLCDLWLPSAFTPNDDGMNDIFYVRGYADRISTFRIFNRWGEIVFEATNFSPNEENFGWDGTFRSQAQSSEVFTYYVEAICIDNDTGEELNQFKNGEVILLK
ncbi:MAG: PKD domain-containing protein [Chitinophagaceae bacterium]|nr:MAG: PKD domain-containing protein [Chitinophagaceae bacterium]